MQPSIVLVWPIGLVWILECFVQCLLGLQLIFCCLPHHGGSVENAFCWIGRLSRWWRGRICGYGKGLGWLGWAFVSCFFLLNLERLCGKPFITGQQFCEKQTLVVIGILPRCSPHKTSSMKTLSRFDGNWFLFCKTVVPNPSIDNFKRHQMFLYHLLIFHPPNMFDKQLNMRVGGCFHNIYIYTYLYIYIYYYTHNYTYIYTSKVTTSIIRYFHKQTVQLCLWHKRFPLITIYELANQIILKRPQVQSNK